MGAAVRGNISFFILELSLVMLFSEWIAGPVLVYFVPKHTKNSMLKIAYVWILVIVILSVGAIKFQYNEIDIPIYSAIFFFQCGISFHNQLLTGHSKFTLFNLLQIIQSSLMIFFVGVFVYFKMNTIEFYLKAMLFSSFIVYLLHLLYSLKLSDQTESKPIHFSAVFRNGGYTTTTNLAHTITNRNSYLLISSLLGSVALGVYSTAISLSEAILMASSSLGLVIYSNVANQKDNSDMIGFVKRSILASILVTVGLYLIVLLIPNVFYNTLLGKDFTSVKSFMLMYFPAILCMSVTQILSHYFSGKGNFKVNFVAGVISAVYIVIIGNYAIKEYGIKGIMLATSTALLLQLSYLVFKFISLNKQTD
jgi:O-antigen/teichoic acid export membrane protein